MAGKLRDIPSMERLLASMMEELGDTADFPRSLAAHMLRQAVDEARESLRQGKEADISAHGLIAAARLRLETLMGSSLCRLVNATGIVLHTNLGRAPLGIGAVERVNEVMASYSNLEYNLASGQRGTRYSHVTAKLCSLTGAEEAIVVNNNAAAVLLVMTALAKGREVVVSRGELVEIGGSFRVPEVLAQSGARLVEVGATNKTHLRDYARAISAETALILKVHTSNYRIVGFTAQPKRDELVKLAHDHGLPAIEDLGSGTLLTLPGSSWQEPTVQECLAEGMDLVTFSGDKLLGAGQAGIIAGKKEYIDRIRQHPLLRALRIDKLSLAALEGTLQDYLSGQGEQRVPVQRLLRRSVTELQEMAAALAQKLLPLEEQGWAIGVVPLVSKAGGGTLPEVEFASWGVSILAAGWTAAGLERRLRKNSIPVIGRIQEEKVLLDVRCLDSNELEIIRCACYDIAKR